MVSGIVVLLLTSMLTTELLLLFWGGLTSLVLVNWMDCETLTGAPWSSMGWLLYLLTVFLVPVVLLSSMDFKYKPLSILFLLMIGVVCWSFLVESLLMFYVLFELSVIPMSILIMGWGLQPERLTATLYMFLYTILSSFPFIMLLLFSMNGPLISDKIMVLMVVPFLVKIPVYLVHIWLPKAHVEAPVYGSMFLAAIMLKVGVYGIYRIGTGMMMSPSLYLGAWSLVGGGLCSIMMLSQTDLKSMIAYSSVVHMSCLLGSLLVMSHLGILGSILMSLAHGVCSSGLFYAVTSQYQLMGSRSIMMASGMISLLPMLTLLWSVSLLMNLSAPPSMSLYSEISLFGTWSYVSAMSLLPIGVMIGVVLVYSLILFMSLSHGHPVKMVSASLSSLKDNLILFLHAHWVLTSALLISWA